MLLTVNEMCDTGSSIIFSVTDKPILLESLFLRACLEGEGYPSKRVTLALTKSSFILRRVYKAARVTRVGGLPYLRAVVTLTGV